MAPRRALPASTKATPVQGTRMPARRTRAASSPAPNAEVAAAITAAEEEVAETIAKRLRPSSP
jgi:hypothetical protein